MCNTRNDQNVSDLILHDNFEGIVLAFGIFSHDLSATSAGRQDALRVYQIARTRYSYAENFFIRMNRAKMKQCSALRAESGWIGFVFLIVAVYDRAVVEY